MDIVQLSMFDGKVCTKCKEWKPNSAFNPRSDNGKLRPWCVECNRKYKKQHRDQNRPMYSQTRKGYYATHKDRIQGLQKQAYDANPSKFRSRSLRFRTENRDKIIAWSRRTYQRFQTDRQARSRKYYNDHRDAMLQKKKSYWRANINRLKTAHRRWVSENQNKVRAARWRYKARKKHAEGTFTEQEWMALCHWFGNVCLACGKTDGLTIDHVVPLVYGGSNWITNLQPLCVSCNCSKQDNTIDYRDPDRLAAFLEQLRCSSATLDNFPQ